MASGIDRLDLGRRGEDAALDDYRARGFREVARNWRCRVGELDLIVEREGLLVVCEVKTRSGHAFGDGWEAVTARKRLHLRRAAATFLLQHPPDRWREVRFDVADVRIRHGRGSADVVVFEDAF